MPIAAVALAAITGMATAESPRALPRGGNALAADIAALEPAPARQGGHVLGADMAGVQPPCGTAIEPSGCATDVVAGN